MERTPETELLGAEDVAGLVGVKESTVWRWCREGKLPCLKAGKHWRVRRAALEQQEKFAELVDARQLVVKTAAIEEAIEEWSAAALVRAQSSHSGTILASASGLWLARGTQMPFS